MRRLILLVASVVALLAATLVPVLAGLTASPAHAASRVGVANDDGDAVADPTYATTLTVRGFGFQAVTGGHGGVYVFFGHVRSGWRPSQGGATGVDYFYVPDSESADNQGFQRFVAFPGSDTAGSANGTMSGDGTWSVRLTVPGAVFEAFDRSGGSRTIDCREVTCGVITVGAHGVDNARNETFTPVRFADLYASGTDDPSPAASAEPSATAAATEAPSAGSEEGAGAEPEEDRTRSAEPVLEVDRTAAVAGRVMPFTAAGLEPGRQWSAVLDDGVAGAGPFTVGGDGRLSGVLTLPLDLGPGTHELRLWSGEEDAGPAVSFAVAAGEASAEQPATLASGSSDVDRWALLAVVLGGAAVLAAAGRLVLLRRRRG